jgi:hypothetical protein
MIARGGGHGHQRIALVAYTGAMKRQAEKASQTSRKRRTAVVLQNPVRITEDEADIIISLRRMKEEPTYSLEEVLRENGRKLDH